MATPGMAAPAQALSGMAATAMLANGDMNSAPVDDAADDSIGPMFVTVALSVWFVLTMAALLPPRVQGGLGLLRTGSFLLLHVADVAARIALLVLVFGPAFHPDPGSGAQAMNAMNTFIMLSFAYANTVILIVAQVPDDHCNCCSGFFIGLVLCVLQGMPVSMATRKDSHLPAQQGRADREEDREESRNVTPAWFHVKNVDFHLETMVVGTLMLHSFLTTPSGNLSTPGLEWSHTHFCALLTTLASASFIALEIDYRISSQVQAALNASFLHAVLHFLFRASEVILRLLTMLGLYYIFAPRDLGWRMPAGIFVVDYILGVTLLAGVGGADFILAPLLLGIALLFFNVVQFANAPGLTSKGCWISRVVVLFRVAESAIVASGVALSDVDGLNFEWFRGCFGASAALYVGLFFYFSFRFRAPIDLHRAVLDGEYGVFSNLLQSSDAVLDINLYDAGGRTPLHLAAAHGQDDCMRLLLEERADIAMRTKTSACDTALHLAAMSDNQHCVQRLVQACQGDRSLLNARNAKGDTAVHSASRSQNVGAIKLFVADPVFDFKLTNNRGLTPAQCNPAVNCFGFDKNDCSNAMADLFRLAESRDMLGTAAGKSALSTAAGKSAMNAGATGAAALDDNESGVVHRAKRAQPNRIEFGISSFILSSGMGVLGDIIVNNVMENGADDDLEEHATEVCMDDFVELKFLGEGSFGKVSLVRHLLTGQLFALKRLDKAKFKAAHMVSNAMAEQYLLKTTRHKFIVALHYAFHEPTFWALVMELCPNGDLGGVLHEFGRPGMVFSDIARFCGETMLGIEHLHAMKVIFRDLKLENVIVDTEYRAKVADFGLAKQLTEQVGAKTMCGSYGYAAPEIMLGEGYTTAVDLYAFGVMFYMMLSGGEQTPKYPGIRLPPVRHSVLKRKIKEAHANPSVVWATDQVGAIELLLNCLAEDEATRPTATEVKQHRFIEQNLAELGLQKADDLLTAGPFTLPDNTTRTFRAPDEATV